MTPTTDKIQATGSGVVLVPADRGPGGYLADMDEVIARTCEAWSQGYSAGYHDGRADRAADAAHKALCADLDVLLSGPTLTDMSGTAEELRERATARQAARTDRIRAEQQRTRRTQGGAA